MGGGVRSGKMGRFLGTGEILQFEKRGDLWRWMNGTKKLKKEKGFVNEV